MFEILKGEVLTTHNQLLTAHVIPTTYDFHSSVEHKRRYFEESW